MGRRLWKLAAALAPGYDAALLVQDYPPPELGEDRPYYQADARAFMRAAAKASIPAAICSGLPENLDIETQQLLISRGVAPLQGIGEATAAIRAAAVFGEAQQKRKQGGDHFIPSCHPVEGKPHLLDEWVRCFAHEMRFHRADSAQAIMPLRRLARSVFPWHSPVNPEPLQKRSRHRATAFVIQTTSARFSGSGCPQALGHPAGPNPDRADGPWIIAELCRSPE